MSSINNTNINIRRNNNRDGIEEETSKSLRGLIDSQNSQHVQKEMRG